MYYNIMLKLIFPQTHFGAVKVVSQGYLNKVTYVYRHTWQCMRWSFAQNMGAFFEIWKLFE